VSLASRTLRNSALVVGARALAKVGVFLVVVLLWRHLGDERYGRFAAMVVYATLAGVIADLGLQTVFVRDVSRDRTLLDRYLGNLLSARLVLSLVALVILSAALRLLAPALFPYTLGAFVLLLTTSYSSLLRAIFYIRGRLGYEAVAILAESGLLILLTLFAISRHASWDAFLWVYAASYLFTCVLAVLVVRLGWRDPIAVRFEPAFLRKLLASGVPLALGFTIATVYAQLDVVLLQLFRNFQMVGWYSAANKYIDAVAWIPQSAMGAVFPALAILSIAGKERLVYAFVKSYKMLAILAIPLAVGLILTAGSLVHSTRGFEQSIGALQLLAPSVVFLFVNNAFIYTLTAMNRQADFTRLALASLALNVVLNLILIPLYGYLGAAAASSLTELGLFLGAWWLLRRQLAALPVISSVARVLASGALMGAVVFVIRSWTLLLVIPIAAAVYVAALVWLEAVDREEWAVVRGGLKLRP